MRHLFALLALLVLAPLVWAQVASPLPVPSPAPLPLASPSADELTPTSLTPPPVALPPDVAFQQFLFKSDVTPAGRRAAVVGYLKDQSGFFVLGGQNASASFTDAWVFSTDSGKWAELTGVPADITGAAYAQAETSALVWMFGGTNSSGAPQNQIQLFDMSVNKFSPLPNSSAPTGVATAGAAGAMSPDGSFFHVFGGSLGNNECSSIIAWSSNQRRWITWNINASLAPPPRSNAALVDYQGTLIMFGGACNGKDADTNVWRFDYRAGNWSADKNLGKLAPSSRSFHIMSVDPSAPSGPALLVYGGLHKSSIYLSDIWSYNLKTQIWSRFAPASLPPPRNDASGLFASGRLLFFGGHYLNTDFNDVWQFVDQSDCLDANLCSACTAIPGCGWCWTNPNYYRCVAGADDTPYLTGSCSSTVSTGFTNDQLLCPVETFPSWAIALIVIGGIVIIGIIIFAIMKMRSADEYEEIR